jgi:hypothetical protein
VDLIAPAGVVNAGDAGIRATGTVSIAAVAVLNASNITAPHTSGIPTAPPPPAPNTAGLTSAARVGGATNAAASDVARQANTRPVGDQAPSVISVQVLGYGDEDDKNGDDDDDDSNGQDSGGSPPNA